MLFWSSLGVCVLFFLGILVLIWLCAVDLKLRLLPDELTGLLAFLGILFRFAAWPYAGPWFDAFLGAIAGAGALALVRAVANRIYGFETMGLGDVKLLGAAGVWLGIEGVVTALCAGAVAGLLHGAGLMIRARFAKKATESFRDMTIPAGPGFCVGIAAIAAWRYWSLPLFGGS